MSTDTLDVPEAAEEHDTDTETSAPKEVVVVANNPSADELKELVAQIDESVDFDSVTKTVQFNFKRSKDSDTGIVTKREPVILAIPFPSPRSILKIVENGGKGLDLLMEAVSSVIESQARDIISDDTSINAANFPVGKVAWDYIANLPKAQRRGGGIPKETWDAFVMDYIEVMPTATGKSLDAVTRAAKLMAGRLVQCKNAEPVLNLLVEQLAIYAQSSENAGDFRELIDFLLNKADQYLNVTDEDLLANL